MGMITIDHLEMKRARVTLYLEEMSNVPQELPMTRRLFQMNQSASSHNLKVLENAGLVEGRRRGKFVYYSIEVGRTGGMKEE